MKKVSSILGLPRRQTIIEVFNILVKYRFLVLVYFAILIIYFIVFFKFKTPADVDNFKISLSASILEDLAMFIFLTVGVTFVSIKLSSISPEDHEFDRRIKALMNSQHVTNDRNVYNFLYNSISKMLNYNKEMIYSVCVLDYHISADTKIFSIETERTHLVTNMCKDKEFDFKDSEVIIGTDQEYSGSYGRVNFLRKVDTKNYNNTIREMLSYKTQDTMLKKGENRFPFDLPLEQDSESAFILSYSVFAKIYDDKTSIDAWNYTEAIRYTSDVVFQLRNNLKSKKSIKFDLRWRDRDKITDIATQETLDYSQTYDLKRKIVLEPGQRLEYYIYALDDK